MQLRDGVRFVEHFEREGISMKNLKNLIEYTFVLPAHNASVERMFSKIKMYWSDQKSRTDIDTVRDFARVVCNLVSDSTQIYDYIKSNPELCERILAKPKYRSWRRNRQDCDEEDEEK